MSNKLGPPSSLVGSSPPLVSLLSLRPRRRRWPRPSVTSQLPIARGSDAAQARSGFAPIIRHHMMCGVSLGCLAPLDLATSIISPPHSTARTTAQAQLLRWPARHPIHPASRSHPLYASTPTPGWLAAWFSAGRER
jgi:hypothetical protein